VNSPRRSLLTSVRSRKPSGSSKPPRDPADGRVPGTPVQSNESDDDADPPPGYAPAETDTEPSDQSVESGSTETAANAGPWDGVWVAVAGLAAAAVATVTGLAVSPPVTIAVALGAPVAATDYEW